MFIPSGLVRPSAGRVQQRSTVGRRTSTPLGRKPRLFTVTGERDGRPGPQLAATAPR